MSGFATESLHGGVRKKDPHGTLRTPVYDSVAFEYEKADDMRLAFEGKKLAHSYSRISNPTVEDFEERIKGISGGIGVLAVSSGMAAISNMVLALAESGSRIVASRFLFGNTLSLFEHTLKPWGLSVDYVDTTDPKQVEAAITDQTRAVFVEIITNPQLQVPDIEALSKITRANGVPLVVDGTTTSFGLFSSKSFGADIEVISSTKSISGGATSVGGLIVDNGLFDWSKNPKTRSWAEKAGPKAFLVYLRREVFRNIGACLSPHNAYLQILGLETLELRLKKSSENALALAHQIELHPKVRSVNYPGLKNSPWNAAAQKQFANGYGALLCFELGGRDECFHFLDKLKTIRRATNINDNKTLAIHPASTIFSEYSSSERKLMGVPDSLVRLSIGIENLEDLWIDIAQALEEL
jgi:O-acetylhomoserine (thiol)-lyase